jgi:hypothetical protein
MSAAFYRIRQTRMRVLPNRVGKRQQPKALVLQADLSDIH